MKIVGRVYGTTTLLWYLALPLWEAFSSRYYDPKVVKRLGPTSFYRVQRLVQNSQETKRQCCCSKSEGGGRNFLFYENLSQRCFWLSWVLLCQKKKTSISLKNCVKQKQTYLRRRRKENIMRNTNSNFDLMFLKIEHFCWREEECKHCL